MGTSMRTLLIVVRHGETEWNCLRRYQGHQDSALSPRGYRQVEALAEGLSGRGIQAMYSSDLGRAVQTSEAIARKLSIGFTLDAGLRERNLGAMQGKDMSQFMEAHPEEARQFASHDPDYAPPGGESDRAVYSRITMCLESIVSRHSGRTILAVTHGGALLHVFRRAVGLRPDAAVFAAIANASINTFSIAAGGWRLESWGEIHHLGTLPALDGIEQLDLDPGATQA